MEELLTKASKYSKYPAVLAATKKIIIYLKIGTKSAVGQFLHTLVIYLSGTVSPDDSDDATPRKAEVYPVVQEAFSLRLAEVLSKTPTQRTIGTCTEDKNTGLGCRYENEMIRYMFVLSYSCTGMLF